MSPRAIAAIITLAGLVISSGATAQESVTAQENATAQVDVTARENVTAQEPVRRPHEAPLFAETPVLPPLPAEYLKHDQTGIRFAYHPSARERVRTLIEQSDAVRSALSVSLGETVLSSVDVRVAVGSADFERVVPAGTPGGAGSVAISQARLLVMALRSGPTSASEVRAAFRRGLAHLALDEVAGYDHLPRWVRVGFALHFADTGSLDRARAIWWASLEQRMLPLADLDHYLEDRSDHSSVAAAQATDFVRFLVEEERGKGWPELVHAARDNTFPDALQIAYQRSDDALENAWRENVAKHKAFLPILGIGTGLWVLLAAGVQIRRRVGARKSDEKARREAASPKSTAKKPKMVKVGKNKRRRSPTMQIPEPDVPKVAHDGRWHTLH